jgi:hypothetical protein
VIIQDWFGKVHVMDRDCGVEKHLLDMGKCLDENTCSYAQTPPSGVNAGTVATILHGDILKGVVLSRKWDRNQGCTESKV